MITGVINIFKERVSESIVEKRSCGMIGSSFFGRIMLELVVFS